MDSKVSLKLAHSNLLPVLKLDLHVAKHFFVKMLGGRLCPFSDEHVAGSIHNRDCSYDGSAPTHFDQTQAQQGRTR